MWKDRWIRAAVVLLFLGVCFKTLAASTTNEAGARYSIRSWDSEDGLPQNTVMSIIQTRDGYLWLGTLGGLVRFDGVRFTVFDESNTPGLNSSRIVKVFEDSQGHLWVGTETAGVVLIKDGQVTSVGIGQGGIDRRLAAACEDATGAVWLYTADGQLWRHRDGRFTVFLIDQGSPSACRALIDENPGPVWVGTDTRQFAIDPKAEAGSLELPVEQSLPLLKLDYLLASKDGGYWRLANGRIMKCRTNAIERDFGFYPWGRVPVSAACEDPQGNLVVGTVGLGVFWFDAGGSFSRVSTSQGLSFDNVMSLSVDREGCLWVGTDGGGLNRVKRQVFEMLDVSRGPADRAVQSVSRDDEGGLWIGSNLGGAVHWHDGVLRRFGPLQGLANPYVWSVFVDAAQQVWVGTWGGGLYQLRQDAFQRVEELAPTLREIHAIFEDRQGRLWIGTKGGLACRSASGWKVFTAADGLSSDEVQAMAEDREGSLWIGTVGGGLNRLRDGQFTGFRKSDPHGLPSDTVSSLHVDPDGILWIGTSGGLVRFHQGQWTRYTTREGLISNGIHYLIEDGQGDLWLGSNAGLMRVPKQALNAFAARRITSVPCRTYGKPDGLPTRECTSGSQPAAARTADGKLWFPTIKGLVSVSPAQLHPNTNPPPVAIESVLIDGHVQNTNRLRTGSPGTVRMPAGKERLEIHYTSLNLAAPERARFRYRLEGHETKWTEAGDARVARYIKLPPGDFTFQVTACNEDGVWNESGQILAVTVVPPIWRTWWFLTVITVFLLGMVVLVVHYASTQRLQRQVATLRQQEAVERERARIARDIHDQLGASLTQVSLLGEMVESDKDQPVEVESHARQICQTARETTRALDEIVWTVNPSNDTLEGLINYICKYAQDYLAVAGLRYRLDVPAELPATPISPEVRHNVFLAAKEAITNVVRHAQASAVWVRLKLEAALFTLEIEDNGRGPAGTESQAAQSRSGLRNMRKRMEDVGGSFSIGPGSESGTLVRLTAFISKR